MSASPSVKAMTLPDSEGSAAREPEAARDGRPGADHLISVAGIRALRCPRTGWPTSSRSAFKAGDSRVRRGGRTTGLGVEFDVHWLSPDEMERRAAGAGFATLFWDGRPAEGQEGSPQGYLLARKS